MKGAYLKFEEERALAEKLIANLSEGFHREDDREVLELRYGLNGNSPHTYAAIGRSRKRPVTGTTVAARVRGLIRWIMRIEQTGKLDETVERFATWGKIPPWYITALKRVGLNSKDEVLKAIENGFDPGKVPFMLHGKEKMNRGVIKRWLEIETIPAFDDGKARARQASIEKAIAFLERNGYAVTPMEDCRERK